MEERRVATLTFVASQLVFLAAVIHVAVGAREWFQYASFGILVPPDIRWPLFVGSGIAILAGLLVARRSERRRPWYLAGAVMMLGYVLAYFLWHLGGHRPLIVAGPGTGHAISLEIVVGHYLAGPLETFTLTVELAAAAMLSVLYVATED
jgi:hypothetical protein